MSVEQIPASRALVPAKAESTGRPSPYWGGYCDRVIELGREGKSRTQIAAALNINRDTLYEWMRVHPEFSDAMRYAKQLEQAWWEDQGQGGINLGKDFNAAAFCFQMKNRFRDAEHGYIDKTENIHKLDASDAFVRMLQAVSGGPRLVGRAA